MNTYRINVYEGSDCDEIRKDIIKLIKLLSVVSKELNIKKHEQYLIIMYLYLVKAIKDHTDYLQRYCPPSTTPPSVSPPPPTTSSSSPPPPPPPPPPSHQNSIMQNYYFSTSQSIPIPYYNFYNYNHSSKNYNEIISGSGSSVNCHAFDNWKCVSGDEIIKYKIRYDGTSESCPNCIYGVQMVVDHGWDNGIEFYNIKYCGTGVCDPVPFVMPEGINSLNGDDVLKLLINVYTGRSLVYPDYYFITRYLGPNTYMIIPIYDPQRKCTQRIQEIYYYMTTYFNSTKIVTITEEEMQVLKKHLFAEPGKELELNTLYSNDEGSCRILKKGNVYEVLIVKKSEEYKIVAAIKKTNEEEAKAIARQNLEVATKKLEVVTKKLEEKVKTQQFIELSPHVIQHNKCVQHTFSQEQLDNFNEKEGIMITNIKGVQTLVKLDGFDTIVGTIENFENGEYKINYCE